MRKELLLMPVVVFWGLVQVGFDGKTYSLAGGESKVFGQEAGQETAKSDNGLLAQLTEFFGLTAEQQKEFPAAEAKYKEAFADFNYSKRRGQLLQDWKAGLLPGQAYLDAKALLRQERDDVYAGTGTLSEILTDKQKADWGAYQQYRMVVPSLKPSLKRKGIELTKDQLTAIREECKTAADTLAGMPPREARFARWKVLGDLNTKVRTKILTEQQRAKWATPTQTQ